MEELLTLMEKVLADRFAEGTFCFPYDKGSIVAYLNQNAAVAATSYEAEGIFMQVKLRREDYNRYAQYLKK